MTNKMEKSTSPNNIKQRKHARDTIPELMFMFIYG